MADEWNWPNAMETQVYQDKQVRIPHSKAVPVRECLRKGYVTRYLPITHHMLPATTTTSHVIKSAQQTTDTLELGDWYCKCRKWRKLTQAICQCGASAYQVVDFQTNTDGVVRSKPSPQELVDIHTGVPPPDDPARLEDQEESDLKKAMALSIQGVPDPDDPARLDDQEESDLKKAVALSIQGEEERQQQLSELEEFQTREAKSGQAGE
jgi:hypothetical protein